MISTYKQIYYTQTIFHNRLTLLKGIQKMGIKSRQKIPKENNENAKQKHSGKERTRKYVRTETQKMLEGSAKTCK